MEHGSCRFGIPAYHSLLGICLREVPIKRGTASRNRRSGVLCHAEVWTAASAESLRMSEETDGSVTVQAKAAEAAKVAKAQLAATASEHQRTHEW